MLYISYLQCCMYTSSLTTYLVALYSLPFNLSIPMGSTSGTYLALVYPNGTLHSALLSTLPTPPGDRNSGIGAFPVANDRSYILDTDFDSYFVLSDFDSF